MTISLAHELQQIRDQIEALEARVRRLEIRAGIDVVSPIPQQRLEQLVDATTGGNARR